jgi:hypothetical protein
LELSVTVSGLRRGSLESSSSSSRLLVEVGVLTLERKVEGVVRNIREEIVETLKEVDSTSGVVVGDDRDERTTVLSEGKVHFTRAIGGRNAEALECFLTELN